MMMFSLAISFFLLVMLLELDVVVANNTQAHGNNTVIQLTDLNFESNIGLNKDWFIKFYASWCQNCKALIPVFEKLAIQHPNVKFGIINTDKNPKLTKMYNITSFPALLYKFDDVVGKYSGPRNFHGISLFLERMSVAHPYLTLNHYNQLHELDSYAQFSDNVSFVLSYNSMIEDNNYIKKKDHILGLFQNMTYNLKHDCSFVIIDSNTTKADNNNDDLKIFKYEPSRPLLNMIVNHWEDVTLEDITSFVIRNNYPLIIIDLKKNIYIQKHLEAYKDTISTLPLKDIDNYIFGYLDGTRFRSFLQSFHTLIPSILLIDHSLEVHITYPLSVSSSIFDTPLIDTNNAISSIIQTITYHSTEIQWKPNYEPSLFNKITYKIIEYSPYSYITILLPILFIALSYLTPYPKEKKIKIH